MHVRYNKENATVQVFKTRRAAESQGNDLPIFSAPENFAEKLSMTELVRVHNAIVADDDAQVKSFKNKAEAKNKVWDAIKANVAPTEVSKDDLEAFRKAETERRAAEKAAAKEAAAEAPAKGKKGKAAPATDAAPKERKPRAAAAQFAGKKIFPLVKENPRKKPGGFGYNAMQLVLSKPGLTYEDYLKGGGRRIDLEYDLERNSIELR